VNKIHKAVRDIEFSQLVHSKKPDIQISATITTITKVG